MSTMTVDALREALEKIAAIPLWGEAIADKELKTELVDIGEYDSDTDSYEPSCDSESRWLEHAVDIARKALGKQHD